MISSEKKVGIRLLAAELFRRGEITYHWQNMRCHCGALFFRPSSVIPTELKCPGCDETLVVTRSIP